MDENHPRKAPTLDELPKEELVKKCKALLVLAQKAKQAKAELAEEHGALKEKHQKLEKDNESLRTMREFVETLTEQKLRHTTQIDSLQITLKSAEGRLLDADTEIVSLKRQNARLEADNEKLLNQLGHLEDDADFRKEIDILSLTVQDKENTITTMKDEIIKCSSILSEVENKLKLNEVKLIEVKTQCESEKIKKEKLNAKLKSYREKLIKCNASISHLKNSKSVLLKTVSDYSESVPKWQRDIINASKLLGEQLLKLESENVELKNRLASKVTETENNQVNEENESLLHRLKALESEKTILINEKKSNKEMINKIDNEKNNLEKQFSKKVEQLNANISELKLTIDRLESEKSNCQDCEENSRAIVSLKEEIASLKCGLVAVEEENKLLCESNEMLKAQLNTISDDQPTLEMRRLMEQNDLLQTDISKLQTKVSSFKHDHSALHNELKDARQRLSDAEALVQDYEDMKGKFSNYRSENSELLKEMKEINQALKERGEVISRQQMEIAELKRKHQEAEEETKRIASESNAERHLKTLLQEKEEVISKQKAEIVELNRRNDDMKNCQSAEKLHLEELLKERDSIIISLEEDISKLKQNVGNVSCDARSDNMSVSTVSKIEENSRLKDLDESFEERYSKLRILALKLKKRVGDLTLQNKALEEASSKNDEEKAIMLSKLLVLENSSKGVEMCDIKKTEAKENHVEPRKLNNDEFKELTNLKKEKSSLDIIVKELQSKMAEQTQVIEDLKQKEAELVKVKDILVLKESQLSVEESQHRIAREALEKSKREVKKKSVLSLEMEDYERSMKELTGKMEEDKKKIVNMESTIDTQQATLASLKTQIKMLEEQLHSEEKSAKEIKDLLSVATENLKEREAVVQTRNEVIANLEKNVEEQKLLSEDINLQLASALGDREKMIMLFESEKSELIAKFKQSENKYSAMQEKLHLTCIELEELKTEFSSYKVRAQSVLRQNTHKDINLEESLKDEMAALKVETDSLRSESEELKMQLGSVQVERLQFSNRCNELQSVINMMKIEKETLAEQHSLLLQKEMQEQKNIKLQMSTLMQCYKKQLSDLEESASDQILKLKKELEFAKTSITRAGLTPLSEDNAIKKQMQFVAIDHVPDDENNPSEEINVALLEREEGEGSESTPSPSPTSRTRRPSQRNKREPIPLEQLLEVDIPDDTMNNYSELDIEQQLANALQQIEIRNRRLSHMTEIVAEAEKEVARRSQLVETLKEEVRRCQRALDRGVHHQNQEYLKNVIVKFLTLNAGDERCRLVPVLNTILTLSPEETSKLDAAAKGIDTNANRGWGSYLPWPSNR